MTISKLYDSVGLCHNQYIDISQYATSDIKYAYNYSDAVKFINSLTLPVRTSGDFKTYLIGDIPVIVLMKDIKVTESVKLTKRAVIDLNGFTITFTNTNLTTPTIWSTESLLIYGMKTGSKIIFNCPCGIMISESVNYSEIMYPQMIVKESTYSEKNGSKLTVHYDSGTFISTRAPLGRRYYYSEGKESYLSTRNPAYCSPEETQRSFYLIGGDYSQKYESSSQTVDPEYFLICTMLRRCEIKYIKCQTKTNAWVSNPFIIASCEKVIISDSIINTENTSEVVHPNYTSIPETTYGRYNTLHYGLTIYAYYNSKVILRNCEVSTDSVRGYCLSVWCSATMSPDSIPAPETCQFIMKSCRVRTDMHYRGWDSGSLHPDNTGYAVHVSAAMIRSWIIDCDFDGCAGGLGHSGTSSEMYVIRGRSRSWYSGHGGLYTSGTDATSYLLDCELGLRNSQTYYSGAAGCSYLGYDSYVYGDNVTFSNYHTGSPPIFVLNWRGSRGQVSYLSNIHAKVRNGGQLIKVRVDDISDLYIGEGGVTFSDGVKYTPDLIGKRGGTVKNVFYTEENYRPKVLPKMSAEDEDSDGIYDTLKFQKSRLCQILKNKNLSVREEDGLNVLIGKLRVYLENKDGDTNG